MSMMVDRRIENGMTLFAEKANPIHTCPHCGAEWEEIIDRDPIGIGTVYYEHDFVLTKVYPIHKSFCRACAMESATMDDLVAYMRARGLLRDFFESLVPKGIMDNLQASDLVDLWGMAMQQHADVIEQRMREFVEEHHEEEFIEWRAC